MHLSFSLPQGLLTSPSIPHLLCSKEELSFLLNIFLFHMGETHSSILAWEIAFTEMPGSL